VAIPLLRTKIHIPRVRGRLVARSRLTEWLIANQASKLILVSAPAGFGKTTLLAEWIRVHERPVAWISLDQADNDVNRFISYIILALQGIRGDFGISTAEMLDASKQPPMETVLTTLVNEANELLEPFMLLLDDYHVITEKPVHDAIRYLLDHLPHEAQMILSTRADPPWPMARLRAKGEIVELRAKDLRFTTQETAEFLGVVMGLDLSHENIEVLEARTEGWIAGLQMAALSMRGKQDADGFIKTLSGSHRFILDYLMEEVLAQQPAAMQDFLLRTSILERMSAPLCDALMMGMENSNWRQDAYEVMESVLRSPVSGLQSAPSHFQSPETSQRILEYLEQNNLFVIPLDEDRVWYRYHHLFSDLLKSSLTQSHPDLIDDIYIAASRWCDEHDLNAEAIQYSLSAGDFERVADLIEEHAQKLIDHGGSATYLGWLRELPNEILLSRPWIRIHQAWSLSYIGHLAEAKSLVQELEDWLLDIESSWGGEVQHLKSHLVAITANLAEIRGDRPLAARLAGEALGLLPESDLMMRSTLLMLRSFCLRWSGEFDEAAELSEEAASLGKEIGNLGVTVMALNDLAAFRIYQGRLHDGLAICEQALEIVRETREYDRGVPLPTEAITHFYMSRIFLQWNDLSSAMKAVTRGLDLCKRSSAVDVEVSGNADLIRTLLALGQVEKGWEIMMNLKASNPELVAARLAAIEVMILILRGEVVKARNLLEQQGITSDGVLDPNQWNGQFALARILVEEGNFEEALNFLDRIKTFADKRGFIRIKIDTLVLSGITWHKMGEDELAMNALQEALSLGEQEGFVRSFLNEGAVMGKLLQKLQARGFMASYVNKLLVELEKEMKAVRERSEEESPVVIDVSYSTLAEPLTERELQVLRLLRTQLSAKEIADELFVAVSTVRSHIKNIYSKLGVHHRMEAISKARELGLVKD